MNIINGNCLDEMKKLADKSIDLMICDLPYGETNCKWDIKIDMVEFWKQFKRVRKHDRVACIHFCSTKFGYQLIKSWEKGYKMDMVWKKRNKTGGLQSRNRPMRNHEMVYFFYDKCPKYNRDKYHKRIKVMPKVVKDEKGLVGVVEEKTVYGMTKSQVKASDKGICNRTFEPPNPASVLEEKTVWGIDKDKTHPKGNGQAFEPPNPASVVEDLVEPAEDEPWSMFESTKVFIGKRHHQTEKPLDILKFFIKYWTDEGDTILDPTMGSGSTGVACNKLKRNFIGFELDPKIFKVAEERIKKG